MAVFQCLSASSSPETIESLPDAPIAKGVELEAGYGMLVGPPTRMLGVPLGELGRPVKWSSAKIDKFKAATDF